MKYRNEIHGIVGNWADLLICNGIWVSRVYNIFLMTQVDHISTLNVNISTPK